MRSAVVVAAFAANALAIPYQKRDEVVVTNVDVVWATDIVTVTAGETADAAAPTTTTAAADNSHHGWGGWGIGSNPWWTAWHQSDTPTSTPVAAPTTPTTTSVYTPPPAPTTTSTTSVYTPPPAPVTTEAPATTHTTEAPTTWAAPTEAPSTEDSGDTPTMTTASGEGVSWAPNAPAYTGYSDIVIKHHNFHRHNHSAPDLSWNDTLAKSAQTIADSCVYAHNTEVDGGGYGQNIAGGVDQNNISSVITDLFYNGEVNWYQYPGPGDDGNPPNLGSDFEHFGHFTQIVWNSTLTVACATSNCTGVTNAKGTTGLYGVGDDTPPFFTVCNYFPSGNWGGEYGSHISKAVSDVSAHWDSW